MNAFFLFLSSFLSFFCLSVFNSFYISRLSIFFICFFLILLSALLLHRMPLFLPLSFVTIQVHNHSSLPSLSTSHIDTITCHLERCWQLFYYEQWSCASSWSNTWHNKSCAWAITSHMLVLSKLLQHLLSWCCFHGFSLRHVLKTTARKKIDYVFCRRF